MGHLSVAGALAGGLAVLALAAAVQAQDKQVYRYTDPDGRVIRTLVFALVVDEIDLALHVAVALVRDGRAKGSELQFTSGPGIPESDVDFTRIALRCLRTVPEERGPRPLDTGGFEVCSRGGRN